MSSAGTMRPVSGPYAALAMPKMRIRGVPLGAMVPTMPVGPATCNSPVESAATDCDTASLASLNLLKVILAERGLKPELKALPAYKAAPGLEAVFMIGDQAIDFARKPHEHEILDLGTAWHEMTGLPFVYAVWALRRIPNAPLRRRLREAKAFGMDTLDYIISSRPEFDYNFRKDYLSWHIHYHLGSDERRGIAKFIELLRKHGLGPVYEPRFVV